MVKTFSLYEIPKEFEEAEIVDDAVLEKYTLSLLPFNDKAKKVLGRFNSLNGGLTGSGTFMNVHLLNSGVLPEKTRRLAERSDIEKALAFDKEQAFLRGNYTDVGVALRTAGDSYEPNRASAERLASQLNKKGIELGSGLLIPFSALTNEESQDSSYGLMLNIPQRILDLKPEQIREIMHDVSSYKWDYSRNEGLAGASFYCGRAWLSDSELLGSSGDDGRVVVIRAAEGVPQKILGSKFTDYETEFAQKRKQYFSDLKNLKEKIDAELT